MLFEELQQLCNSSEVILNQNNFSGKVENQKIYVMQIELLGQLLIGVNNVAVKYYSMEKKNTIIEHLIKKACNSIIQAICSKVP